ncbi:MAG: epoxyqueuosine reductase QueH [Candidatus Omnitrophota bacterium]
MKVLLHTCCAPCLIHPLERLRECGWEVSAIFYNPNIHPFAEYNLRKQALEEFCRVTPLEVFYPEYLPSEFFQAVNLMEEKSQRCPVCWFLRLNRTAEFAKSKGFDAFTSTLLASPYQDQQALKKIASDISKEKGIEFFYEDFRPGFKRAHQIAREYKIYCQNYCGCVYSEIERHRK